jgi:glycosyltransferase involved in cell wall biosynthesis
MKVLYCILDNRCGGPHRLAHATALRLRQRGVETLFLLGYKAGESWQPEGFQRFLCGHIQCVRRQAPIRNLLRFAVMLPYNLLRIRQIIGSHSIDLVHVDGVTNFVPALAARLARRPLIWLYNDYVPGPMRPVLIPLLRRLASTVVVQGECLKRQHAAGDARLRAKTAVLYSGVDTHRFNPAGHGPERRRRVREELGLPPDCPLVGIIRNVNRFKGFTYFLEAAGQIKQRVPSAKFAIVGSKLDTDLAYWDELQQLTARLGLGGDVIYTGFRDDIPAILSALDVFVLASIEESCPVALLEAMAMEVPVVATDVGAVAEMVEHGRTGFVVPPRDSAAIAEAALRYLEGPPEQTRRMAQAARKKVEADFEIEIIAAQQQRLYKNLLAGSRHGQQGSGSFRASQ